MALTTLTEVTNQIQKFWAPMFMKELRAKSLLGALVNKEYSGEIKQMGDRVRISQVNAPAGQLLTSPASTVFTSDTLSTSYVDVTANKRAVAAYEFADLVDIQSQIGAENSAIRESLLYAVEKQINDYLYSIVAPSAAAPDHVLNSVTDMNAAQLLAIRLLAAQAKWDTAKPWYGLLDPSYYNDVLNAQTMTSSDYVAGETPVVGGQIANKRFNFNLLEDNSRSTDTAIFFHPDFMHLAMGSVNFKVSDQHSAKSFSYVISADIVFGAAQGIDGDNKVVSATAAP